ncbi:CLUMA_CG017332, isoform B [Clunio marinus]|uniref:CLUMA_CG017332, isoform B n=1 Tax=Clunio marinus TaxID=568069 RepID=A0A1J1IXD5_9DIPT|nr:CLUMA_CG017332, isoform B [Clunio marinus]
MKLQLQGLLVLWIICMTNGAPYSKYGRSCKDIGCLPRETCVMAYESCSFSQQENVSCGRYPTCKKNSDAQSTQQSSGPTYPSRTPSDPNASVWNFPATTKYTTQRTTTTTTTTTRRPWTTKSPFYNPANPSYSGGGGYYGNRYGDDTTFGGFSRPTTRYTTKRPSSSGGFSSFFSDFSNILSGDVGKLIGGALSSRGGSSGGGGFGSFFGGGDTRPLIENRNYRGGLFSENSGSSTNYNAYPVTRYGQVSPSTPKPSSASHGNFGWKMT